MIETLAWYLDTAQKVSQASSVPLCLYQSAIDKRKIRQHTERECQISLDQEARQIGREFFKKNFMVVHYAGTWDPDIDAMLERFEEPYLSGSLIVYTAHAIVVEQLPSFNSVVFKELPNSFVWEAAEQRNAIRPITHTTFGKQYGCVVDEELVLFIKPEPHEGITVNHLR